MTTVKQFADQLGMPVQALLTKLKRSLILGGPIKEQITESTHLSDEDISRLLEYLRLRRAFKNKEEKNMKHQPPVTESKALRPLAKQEKTVFDESVQGNTTQATKYAKER